MSDIYAPHPLPATYDKFTPPSRELTRTPSPTPSECKVLEDDGKRKSIKQRLSEASIKELIIFGVVAALGIAMMVFHDQIVKALEPASNWMYKTPGGWAIPIGILILLSIPPLFGHEIVIVLIGLTWGLGWGFLIASAGTLLGELLTFVAFKFFMRNKAQVLEDKSISYALLSRVIADGGLKIAIIARYSVIPGHLLTALFTTCGMSLTTFIIAAVVSLPKQLVGVYLGYALRNTDNQSRLDKIIKFGTIAITVVITIFAAKYMKAKQTAVKDQVVYERRKRRQAKMGGVPIVISGMPSGGDVEQGRYEERVPLSATDYQKFHNPAVASSYPPTYGQ